MFLRICIRYKYVYAVFPRAYSKSFLSVLILLIRGILYPGAHLFSTAGGKEQAAQILQEKVEDICSKIPAFAREIDWGRGATRIGKDSCKYVLKSGTDLRYQRCKFLCFLPPILSNFAYYQMFGNCLIKFSFQKCFK